MFFLQSSSIHVYNIKKIAGIYLLTRSKKSMNNFQIKSSPSRKGEVEDLKILPSTCACAAIGGGVPVRSRAPLFLITPLLISLIFVKFLMIFNDFSSCILGQFSPNFVQLFDMFDQFSVFLFT